jgi:predicted Zn-dependent peptidase
MNKQEFTRINEILYHEVLDNGLNVFLLPKKGFHKSYVTFSTKLGSIMTKIQDKDGNITDLPMGIAHFLEHKLFEQDGSDVSRLFSQNQANVNAFTQNNRTTYLFSCTDKLTKNIDLLINFVQNPYFTKEGIEKEKGIIESEIKMYEDDPNTVAYMSLIRNMFQNHPVRYDILGTIDTISKIDKEILVRTHKTYYDPKNMLLFITGNFEVNEIVSHIRANQENVEFDCESTPYDDIEVEDLTVVKKSEEVNLEVTVPNFLLGVKQGPTNYEKEDVIKKELCFSILLDLVLGKSTNNYMELLSNELVNDSFGLDITLEKSYGFFLVGSETYKPKELEVKLKEILLNLDDEILKEEDFLRIKKQIVGGFIHALNSIEYIANQFTKYYYLGASLFDILEIADKITLQDIENTKKAFENENSYSTFTVYPKKNDE